MLTYRIRQYGQADWTDIYLDGELEEFAGEALVSALAESEDVLVQQKGEDGEWEDAEWAPGDASA